MGYHRAGIELGLGCQMQPDHILLFFSETTGMRERKLVLCYLEEQKLVLCFLEVEWSF